MSDSVLVAKTPRSRGIDTYCVHCAAPVEDHHRFCGQCGSALHARCPHCLTLVDPGIPFCTACGAHVGRLDGGRFAAPHAGLERHEERRTVTILFVDLIGFTSLAERLDPEDVRDLQATYFRTASRIVRTYGGVVEKYIGDAVMAVFGAPVSGEHDAFRAVRTGLELQRALDGQAAAAGCLRARVGIATGEALVDLDAIRDRGQALVTGDVVNTAARIQTLAPAGGVLVNAATRRATSTTVRYDEVPPVQPEGKATAVEVWLARDMYRDPLGLDTVDSCPVVGTSSTSSSGRSPRRSANASRSWCRWWAAPASARAGCCASCTTASRPTPAWWCCGGPGGACRTGSPGCSARSPTW
jgi:class 3 adenylate cyclase